MASETTASRLRSLGADPVQRNPWRLRLRHSSFFGLTEIPNHSIQFVDRVVTPRGSRNTALIDFPVLRVRRTTRSPRTSDNKTLYPGSEQPHTTLIRTVAASSVQWFRPINGALRDVEVSGTERTALP